MRLVLLVFAILLAGCIAPETAGNDANQTNPPAVSPPANDSQVVPPPPETSGNISVIPHETAPQNETQEPPPINETHQNPESEPPKPPEGLAFGNGSYLIALDDASLVPTSAEPCGIFSLWASNGSLIEKMFICPGQSEMWDSPGGGSYRIKVVQVAAGYSGSAAWAKVIIYGGDPAPASQGGRQNASASSDSRMRQACCEECKAAYSQSPIAVGPQGARCGHFMTGAPISAECADYFEASPSTVSECG